jgi:von Willebrand factor type A domain
MSLLFARIAALMIATVALTGCGSMPAALVDAKDSHDDGAAAAGSGGGAGGLDADAEMGEASRGESGPSDASAGGGGTRDASGVDAAQKGTGLDVYVLFDQSGSMLNPEQDSTRIERVTAALGQFLLDEASAGIGIGIGFFGQMPIGQASCDPADYASPTVGFGVLPDAAPPILDALAAIAPTGETPTGAALRGACIVAHQRLLARPGSYVVILLVTDGEPKAEVSCTSPKACCPTLADAMTAARDCATGAPGIPTYVVGVGPLLDALSQIAEAGRTSAAYLAPYGSDVPAQLRAFRNDALAAAAQH